MLSTPVIDYSGVVQLAAVEDFLNTLDERTFAVQGTPHVPSDALTSAAGLAEWLSAHGFAQKVGKRELAAAVSLRTALRAALGANSSAAAAQRTVP